MFKRKETNELATSDIVLHPIYRPDGLLFVKKYKKLSESIIQHIKKQFPSHFPFLVVESEQQLDEFIQNQYYTSRPFYEALKQTIDIHRQYIHIPLSIELYEQTLATQTEKEVDFFNELNIFAPTWSLVEKTLESPRLLHRAKQMNEQLSRLIAKDPAISQLYQQMREYHDVLAVHSVNTTVISLMIGLALELKDDALIELCLATLFADIGFIKFPKEQFVQYLNHGKPQENSLKNHLKHSVEIIATSSYCRRKDIIYGILDHHEEFQGTGIPNGKAGENIHLYGRIIAIAQYYDELVGGYVSEKSHSSFEAIEHVWEERGKKFDPNILRIFLDKSKIYKVGQIVQINHHEWGTVIGFKDYIHYPLHPIVQKNNGDVYDLTMKLKRF
jgi:HD-GYP domain-containing protein (c-di-GMP phosphodiesterase class II)